MKRTAVPSLPLRLLAAALFAVLFSLGGIVSAAEQNAPPSREETLDTLFERLVSSVDEESADLVVASILRVWLDSDSDTIDVLVEHAVEAMEDEDFEIALQILDEVVELAPDYAEGWNKRATVHYMMRNYGASIHDVQRTLALEPRHFGAMAGLGTMLKETGRDEAALEIFRRALALNPHLPAAKKAIEELAPEVEGREI